LRNRESNDNEKNNRNVLLDEHSIVIVVIGIDRILSIVVPTGECSVYIRFNNSELISVRPDFHPNENEIDAKRLIILQVQFLVFKYDLLRDTV